MNKIGKYEFDSLEQAESKINALGIGTDDDGNTYPTHKHCIVKLGYIVLEQGEYNEDGEEVKAPILSDKYHVDVLWKGLEPKDAEAEVLSYVEPSGWEANRIELDNNGVHSFMGLDYQLYKF
tara:strand:+ start:1699 stop:2064 length:366 start_codon:yes stop_codon:yes gene_type:complete